MRRLVRHGRVACRLLGLAKALDGERAARQAGINHQMLRNWVIRFNAEEVAGLRERAKSCRPAWLDYGQRAAPKGLVLRGPDPEREGVKQLAGKDLCRLLQSASGRLP